MPNSESSKPLRVLILSFYAPPDLCAGSFRLGALLDALKARGGSVRVVCLTTMPNRYHELSVHANALEDKGNAEIHRFSLPDHDNGMLKQTLAFIQYASQARRYVNEHKGEFDLVFATSSRLMTATLGAWASRKLRVPLYLDIRDLFLDTLRSVLAKPLKMLLLPALTQIERITFRQASRINLVSEGFAADIEEIAPKVETRFFTNGIDEEFMQPLPRRIAVEPVRILYAGNIGAGQGLELVLPSAALMLQGQAVFDIVGSGGRREALKKALQDAGVENVVLHNPVPRNELMQHYANSDILWLNLNDVSAFRKVLPSKLFEYGSLGKPVLAGVAGYAATFVRGEIVGSHVYTPCDPEGLVLGFHSLRSLPEVELDREPFRARFRRKTVMKKLSDDIIALHQTHANQ